ncbi:ferritin-like domain-containing protein [Paraburkholderia xenovorans]|uniref:ferritin-like domain-containing protein n=1 Tax=Paraburkholderia xenovorans TaxID=36873 RepID=UPI0038BA78DA
MNEIAEHATPVAFEPQDVRWTMPVDALMSDDYEMRDEALNRLYEKAKAAQWDVAKDVDWSSELDPDNPLGMPDPTLLIYGTDLWGKLDDKGRREVRHHAQGWLLSQILHGEQAAVICASKLASAEEGLSARLCAATQVMDEARHVEAYARLVEKLEVRYPMSRSLRSLLEDTITSSALDMTNLGMQVLVEGIALSIFQSVVAYSSDPFIKDLFARIQRDESRHFAVGRITLCRVYADMSARELREREQFICEGASVLYEHLCADDIWEPMGLSRRDCSEMVRQSPVSSSIRRSIFRRLVPTIREMGLLTPTVQSTFEKLNVLDYAAMPLN